MNARTIRSAADRVMWLVPVAALAGGVLGPLAYLLFDAQDAPPEVVAGITGFGAVLGFTVGIFSGILAAAPAWLLLRARHPAAWAALAAGAGAASPPAVLSPLCGAAGQALRPQEVLVLAVAVLGAAGFVAWTQSAAWTQGVAWAQGRPAGPRAGDPTGLDRETAAGR